MATMQDIAERAGVALSTVSYVLSGKRSVSEATRQRVFKAIAELDYQPHALARGLASRRSKAIALLFPSPEKGLSEMRLEFVTSAAEVAAHHGYGFMLSTTPDDAGMVRLVQEGRVDGLILMEITLHDPRVELLQSRGVPFSLIGHCAQNDGISFVDLDFEQALAACVAHLAGLGHQQVAFINSSQSLLDKGYGPAVRSLRGFEGAISAHGLVGTHHPCETSSRHGYLQTQQLLAALPNLTALIVTHEQVIGGVAQAIYDAGLRIPDDLSLLGMLPSRSAELLTPPLTSIDFPSVEMGRLGAELLIKRLEGDERPIQKMLQGSLAVRQSSGPPRGRSSASGV